MRPVFVVLVVGCSGAQPGPDPAATLDRDGDGWLFVNDRMFPQKDDFTRR